MHSLRTNFVYATPTVYSVLPPLILICFCICHDYILGTCLVHMHHASMYTMVLVLTLSTGVWFFSILRILLAVAGNCKKNYETVLYLHAWMPHLQCNCKLVSFAKYMYNLDHQFLHFTLYLLCYFYQLHGTFHSPANMCLSASESVWTCTLDKPFST